MLTTVQLPYPDTMHVHVDAGGLTMTYGLTYSAYLAVEILMVRATGSVDVCRQY